MRRRGTVIGTAFLLAIGIVLVYAVWRIAASPESQVCHACSRPIHPENRTVGMIDGKRELFCCPRCALTEHLQTGRLVDVVELSDYSTGRALSPDNATVVEGSDVNICMNYHIHLDREKQASPLAFDRCSPSIIAFGTSEAAANFQKVHGGTLMSFRELEAAYQR
jgi:hypothetical protein